MIRLTLVKEAAYFAISAHGNQTYDGYPYYYHLEEVVDILREFGFTEDKYIISGYLHDAMEDTAVSYNDIKEKFGIEVAEIVYAVTDELGRNRKERKAKTYPKIKENKDAIIVKLGDRISNMRNSLLKGHKMSDMYIKEYKEFRSALDTNDWTLDGLWGELDNMYTKFLERK